MLETLLRFVDSWSDVQIMIVVLGCMAVFGLAGRLITGSLLVGIFLAESINCLNLTIIVTSPWIGLDTKPFYSLWMTLFILFVPYVILFVSRAYSYHSSDDVEVK